MTTLELCDDFTRGHVVEVCRDRCAEESVGGEPFQECVKRCVKELAEACRQ